MEEIKMDSEHAEEIRLEEIQEARDEVMTEWIKENKAELETEFLEDNDDFRTFCIDSWKMSR
jgi:hypothetical protein